MKVSIVPLVIMKDTVFFFISSKSDKNSNQHSGLMSTIRASGEFRIHNLVTVCADCRRNGVAGDCMHAERPPWKDGGQQMRKVGILMQGDAVVSSVYILFFPPPFPLSLSSNYHYHQTKARELDNIDIETTMEAAFSHESIRWIETESDKWGYDQHFEKDIVFIGIDPACGGLRSRYAIISVILHKETPNSAEKLVVWIYYFVLSFCFLLFFVSFDAGGGITIFISEYNVDRWRSSFIVTSACFLILMINWL